MDADAAEATGGKDLQDLRNLSRRPIAAFLQKQLLPRGPRQSPPGTFQALKMFLPGNLWQWARDYVRYRFGPKHPFLHYTSPEHDNGIYPLGGDSDPVRVALAGDWGTGTDEAFKVAELIGEFAPHYAIHLGDVYFVGDPNEVKENFLGIRNPRHDFTPCRWPCGSRGTFALNGNHEMYARGQAYFDLILPALGMRRDGTHQGQKASFFCLENARWRVIALDTGYDSVGIPIIENIVRPRCALPDALIDWLRSSVVAREDHRGIVLLGHHQYYSRFDVCYTRQAEQLAGIISRPVLWFWGHEHRLAVYREFRIGTGIVAHGRCIGHGGMPVDLPPASARHPECEVEFVDRRRYLNDEHLDVGFNGFARLTFAGSALVVDYVDVAGNVIFNESWTVDDAGGIARTPSDTARPGA